MRLVVLGLVLVAGAYFLLQTPQGRAMVLQASAAGRTLSDHIVGNLTH
ncbi:MAG TPA: hypothetical protein VN634_12955 [Candidatus Limnocylindrales bacterium]|nr:hypothetical protein [Candidatus Limnocylindrales bacterium]